MRFGCIIALVAFYLLIAGGQKLYDAIVNAHPKTITYSDFRNNPPDSGWYHITGCQLDLTRMLVWQKSGQADETYIPIYAANGVDAMLNRPDSDQTPLLASFTDSATLRDIADFNQNTKGTVDQSAKWIITHEDEVFPVRDIEGTVRHGTDVDSDLQDKIASTLKVSSSYFDIVDAGNKPSALIGIIEVLGGLACLAVGVSVLLASRRPAA